MAAPAPADEEPALSGRALRWRDASGQPREVALPCEGRALLHHGGVTYIACGDGGLLEVTREADAAVVSQRRFAGQVVGLFVHEGQVWLKVIKQEARPLSELPFTDAPASATTSPPLTSPIVASPAPTPQAAASVGPVVENLLDTVIIGLGTAQGVEKGDHVEVFVQEKRALGQGEEVSVERRVLVGEVTAAGVERAEVTLGINEEVPADSVARETEAALTASLLRPRRADDLWELSAAVRPFLALGTLGAGMVSDLSVGYRFTSPLHVAVYVEPLALGFAEGGNAVAVAANGFVGYDTRFFELGLGLGWSAINDTPSGLYSSDETSSGGEATFERVKSGLSIGQLVRLGARDGLSLEVRNGFLLVRDQFDYGGTVGQIQVPLVERWWLLFRGGGGSAGYAYGELGLRILTHGNGERRSLFLTASVGGASVWGEKDTPCYSDSTQTCTESISYGGPMAGFGVEWRP
jgi:hypothetical protein